MEHRRYLPFAETLYDQPEPVGNLGRGTHYSVLRFLTFRDQFGRPTPTAMNQDIAIIWDEDHDARVVSVVQSLYEEQLLHPVLFVGERKGTLSVLVAPEFGPKLAEYVPKIERHAEAVENDPWTAGVASFAPGNGLGIISAKHEDIDIYLLSVHRLWSLGVKPRTIPRPPTLADIARKVAAPGA